MNVLVTGGAGFIGSHLVDALDAADHFVTVIDSLEEQVHGKTDGWEQKPVGVRFFESLSGDRDGLEYAHDGQPFDVVYHLAAVVGVGQSQYKIAEYVDRNVQDTADMLQFWVDNPELRPKRLVVASSMSVYGEALPITSKQGQWKASNINDRERCPNIYAVTKLAQEKACIEFCMARGIRHQAFRFFNVYGERQSLDNPYTGVAALFGSRLIQGKGGLIYYTGEQTRDFIHVSDIVRGLMMALTADVSGLYNLGTGRRTSLLTLHRMLAAALEVDIAPIITNVCRKGDIYHCFADIGDTQRLLGWNPCVSLEEGIVQYARWLKTQDTSALCDKVDRAQRELEEEGLLIK